MTVIKIARACHEEAHCNDIALYRYTYHGCGPGDVLFTNAVTGSWNISRFEELMESHPHYFTEIDATLDEAVALYVSDMIETDPIHVAALTPERLKMPLYGLWIDGTVMVIDGHHRVMRLWQEGVRLVKVIMLHEALTGMVKVERTKEPVGRLKTP